MKPCSECGRPLGNDEERCDACGGHQSPSVHVEPVAPPRDKGRPSSGPSPGDREWLAQEARAAAAAIGRNLVTATVFATVGATIGCLLSGRTGLVIGALLGALASIAGAFIPSR